MRTISDLCELTAYGTSCEAEAFFLNEYRRLTGAWFAPQPHHFWELKKGTTIKLRIEGEPDYIGEFVNYDYRGILEFKDKLINRFVVKKMCIISYDLIVGHLVDVGAIT